jgi:hypothetical protein
LSAAVHSGKGNGSGNVETVSIVIGWKRKFGQEVMGWARWKGDMR